MDISHNPAPPRNPAPEAWLNEMNVSRACFLAQFAFADDCSFRSARTPRYGCGRAFAAQVGKGFISITWRFDCHPSCIALEPLGVFSGGVATKSYWEHLRSLPEKQVHGGWSRLCSGQPLFRTRPFPHSCPLLRFSPRVSSLSFTAADTIFGVWQGCT